MKERLYKLDNFKVILIFLVVVGHLLNVFKGCGCPPIRAIYVAIYLFHVPAFFLISGYLTSSDRLKNNKNIITYVVLYVLMYLYVWGICMVLSLPCGFDLFYPRGGTWFFFCLALFRLLLPFIEDTKYILPISLVGAVAIGWVEDAGMYMSLARFFSYLPFFVCGVKLRQAGSLLKIIDGIKSKKKYTFGLLFAMLASSGFLEYLVCTGRKYDIVKCRASYASTGLGNIEGSLIRIVYLIAAFSITFMILAFISNKNNKLTYIGRGTLGIFFFHPIFKMLAKKYVVVSNSLVGGIEAIILSAIITLILGLPIFTKVLLKITNWINSKLFEDVVPKSQK